MQNKAKNTSHVLALSSTSVLADAITSNAPAIIDQVGTPLATAKQVHGALHALDINYSLTGERLRCANVVGDVLGVKHLNLLAVSKGTKRHYFLPMLLLSEAEKEEFMAKPQQEQISHILKATRDFRPAPAFPMDEAEVYERAEELSERETYLAGGFRDDDQAAPAPEVAATGSEADEAA